MTNTFNSGEAEQSRANVYELCSRLLAREIDPPLYRRLLGSPMVDPHIAAMDEQQALDELAVEFCRLFVGPQPVCLPYASTQRGEAMLGARAERGVREFIRRHGLDVALGKDVVVLALDHLSVLLALLAHLHHLAARGADVREPTRELVRRHLHPWAMTTADRIADNAELEPYVSTARLLSGLLRDDWQGVG